MDRHLRPVLSSSDLLRAHPAHRASVTQHEVRATAEQLARLGLQACEPRLVVEESLRFLLEREPKEAIVASFDLDTITGYFPEFPGEIRRRMNA